MDNIRDYVNKLRVIDTHEHLWDESWRLLNPGDFTALFWHYGSEAMRSSGLTNDEYSLLFDNKTATHNEKWEIFNKYWPLVQYTATMQAVIYAIRDIYGIDTPYTNENMFELTRRIREKVKPGFYNYIMRELSNIEYCFVCCFDRDELGNRRITRTWGDTELMRPDFTADQLLCANNINSLEKETGVSVVDFRHYINAFNIICDKYLPVCADIKIGLAYSGALDFYVNPDLKIAEDEYINHLKMPMPPKKIKSVRSYLIKLLLEKAEQYNKSVKFHTGILCGSYSDTSRDLSNIARLALQFPNINIALMHMTYPHYNEIPAALANIPNLYVDLCWAWSLDPYAAKQIIKQLLCAVPIHKIMAYGGDYSLPENVYGNLLIARRMIGDALSEMIDDGAINYESAVSIADWLLRKSAIRFYYPG